MLFCSMRRLVVMSLVFVLVQAYLPTLFAQSALEPTVKLYYPGARAEVVDVRPFLDLSASQIRNHLTAVQKQYPEQVAKLARHISIYAAQQDYSKHRRLLAELTAFDTSFGHGMFLSRDTVALKALLESSEEARLQIPGIEDSCDEGSKVTLADVALEYKNIEMFDAMQQSGYRFVLGNAFCDVLAKMGSSEHYDEKLVEWFLTNVSDLERYQTDIYYGGRLQHWVVNRQVEAGFVKQLAAHGFDFNITNSRQQTPLHLAISDGFADVLEALILSGVDINAKDREGKTAYDILLESDVFQWTEADLVEQEESWQDVREYHQQYLDMQSLLQRYGAETNFGTLRWQVEPISYQIFIATWILIGFFSFLCLKLANGFYAFWLSWVFRLSVIAPLITMFISSGHFIADKDFDKWIDGLLKLFPFITYYVVSSAALLGLAKVLHNRGAGKTSIPARWIVSNEKIPYVVYLRAFFTDSTPEEKNHSAYLLLFAVFIAPLFLIFFLFRKTREENEVEVFRKFGPVVGIGNPTEPLPLPGAYRLYVGTEGDWQSEVKNRLKGCSLCVIRMAETEGVTWEINNVLNRLPLEKILLIVSGDMELQMRYRTQLEERMKSAGHQLDNAEWTLLEERIKSGRGQTIYIGFAGAHLFHTASLDVLTEFLMVLRELYAKEYEDENLQELLNSDNSKFFNAIGSQKLTREEIKSWTGR